MKLNEIVHDDLDLVIQDIVQEIYDKHAKDDRLLFDYEVSEISGWTFYSKKGRHVQLSIYWREQKFDLASMYDGEDESVREKLMAREGKAKQKKALKSREAILDIFKGIAAKRKELGLVALVYREDGGSTNTTKMLDKPITIDDIPENGMDVLVLRQLLKDD